MSLEYQDNDNNITFIMVLTEFVWLLKHSLFNGKVSLFSFRTKLPSLIIPVMLLYLVAADGTPSIRCNTKALQGGVYRLAGEMLSTMVTQGGPSPKLLDAHTCRYIEVGTGTMPPVEVTDMAPTVAAALNKVCVCKCFWIELRLRHWIQVIIGMLRGP